MFFNKIFYHTHPLHLIFLTRWLPLVLFLLTFGCGPASIESYPPEWQAESPLIPGTNLALVENRWRLVEGAYQGKTVEFDAIQPVYVTFMVNAQLVKRTTNCNAGGYYIIAESENRYRLIPGAGTAMDCGEIGNEQYSGLSGSIGATTAYEIQDDQLILTGPDVRLIFARESGLFPTVNVTLTDNRWRVVEVRSQGKTVAVDALQPIYVDFSLVDVHVSTKECILHIYRIADERELGYQLVQADSNYVLCNETISAQYADVADAVAKTTAYAIEGSQLTLHGDNIQVMLEIDNSR